MNDACKEGWYELVYGGFVCGKYATLDMSHPKLSTAPHAPFLDQPLPYQYAYNIAHGTPLYRTVPSTKERLTYEPWLVHKPKPKVEEEDAGVIADFAATNVATLGVSFGVDPDDAGTPWYLKDWDGGKPLITLDELREDGGPIVRRMVKGFYLALDTDIEVNKHKWWKSTAGYLARRTIAWSSRSSRRTFTACGSTPPHRRIIRPRSRSPMAARRRIGSITRRRICPSGS